MKISKYILSGFFNNSHKKINNENKPHLNLNKECCAKVNKTYCSPLHQSQDLEGKITYIKLTNYIMQE
jgi:hypothetical protein